MDGPNDAGAGGQEPLAGMSFGIMEAHTKLRSGGFIGEPGFWGLGLRRSLEWLLRGVSGVGFGV